MITLSISIVIEFDITIPTADFNQLTPSQQEQYKKEIIIDDLYC